MIKYCLWLTGGSLRSILSPREVHLKSPRRGEGGQGRSGGGRVIYQEELEDSAKKMSLKILKCQKWISGMVEYDFVAYPE